MYVAFDTVRLYTNLRSVSEKYLSVLETSTPDGKGGGPYMIREWNSVKFLTFAVTVCQSVTGKKTGKVLCLLTDDEA